jgi:hypothetical protein
VAYEFQWGNTMGGMLRTIIERGELKPGVAFLAKPFTMAQLSAKVREVLSGD